MFLELSQQLYKVDIILFFYFIGTEFQQSELRFNKI